RSFQFQHRIATIYYYISCIEKFNYKKNVSEKDKEEYEEQYQKTEEISKLVEKYKELEDKGIICSLAKEILGHRGIYFPKYLNSNSKQNLNYSQKKWNTSRCKDPKHKNDVDVIIKYMKKFVIFAMNLVSKKEHWLIGQSALKNQKNHQSEDLTDFINSRFDIKFNEEVDIIEAQKYVYDDDIKNLYKKDNIVYMKREVDINYILGEIICNINYEDNNFWIYNLYWNKDLPDNILLPKNLKTIGQKLQEKIL
ncbi:33441_t:CDS:2, partial [Gigaspora margarita]